MQGFRTRMDMYRLLPRMPRPDMSVLLLTMKHSAPPEKMGDIPGLVANDDSPPKTGKIRFLHLRIHGDKHKTEENKRGIDNKGGITVAYQRSEDLRYFRYAIAMCSLKENFSRYTGRMVAQQYLDDDMEHYVLPTDPAAPNSAFLSTNVMRKATQLWLKLHPKFNMKSIG